jgi:hypothetical protein
MITKVKKAYKNPGLILPYILAFKIFRLVPDRKFLKVLYKIRTGQILDLDNPLSFNEKLQWLKLYDRKSRYTLMVDKYEVRKYVKETIGEECLMPLLGVYDSYDEIDFDSLPNKFVLKASHASGNVFICKDKAEIDHAALRNTTNAWVNRNYYWLNREWPYKNVKPRLVIEEYISDKSGKALKDYKIFCFSGEPRVIQVNSEKEKDIFFINHFNLEWGEIELPRIKSKKNPLTPAKPKNLGRMLEICRLLSKDIPFLRVDLYETEKGIFFGETTFYPMAGFLDFADPEDDYLLGSWMELPKGE